MSIQSFLKLTKALWRDLARQFLGDGVTLNIGKRATTSLLKALDFGSGKTEIIVQSTVGSSLPQNMKFARVS